MKRILILLGLITSITFLAVGCSTQKAEPKKETKATQPTNKSKNPTMNSQQEKKITKPLDESKLTSEQKQILKDTKGIYELSNQYEEKKDVKGYLSTIAKGVIDSAHQKNISDLYKSIDLQNTTLSVQPVKLTDKEAVLRITRKAMVTKKIDPKAKFSNNIATFDLTLTKENGEWKQSKREYLYVTILDDKGNEVQKLGFNQQNQPFAIPKPQPTNKQANK